tara:strand:+ start:1878 stop:2675 length:798 start_codon:yes stop_codon:yes gene_type:complete
MLGSRTKLNQELLIRRLDQILSEQQKQTKVTHDILRMLSMGNDNSPRQQLQKDIFDMHEYLLSMENKKARLDKTWAGINHDAIYADLLSSLKCVRRQFRAMLKTWYDKYSSRNKNSNDYHDNNDNHDDNLPMLIFCKHCGDKSRFCVSIPKLSATATATDSASTSASASKDLIFCSCGLLATKYTFKKESQITTDFFTEYSNVFCALDITTRQQYDEWCVKTIFAMIQANCFKSVPSFDEIIAAKLRLYTQIGWKAICHAEVHSL